MNSATPVKTILILSANPKGTNQLRLGEEIREIKEGLLRAKIRDRFSIKSEWAVRYRDIHRSLLKEEPQIVHFCGHGAGEEGLVFEDQIGQEKLVDAEALAGLFEMFADRVECVLLNACYSEMQAKAIAQHINYVIGMSKAIGDKAAIEFAVGFYDALGAGRSIDFAYELGCRAIRIAGIEEHLTPVLLKKPTVATVSTQEKHAIEIFVSYASENEEDKKLRDELAKHLKLMERRGLIKAWSDRDISAGEEWESESEKRLNSAQIILLLISPDFMVSEFCWSEQLERAMQRHKAKEARVIPIILRPVEWQEAPFGKLQPLPRNRQPVTNWINRDQAFADITKDISNVVSEQLASQP